MNILAISGSTRSASTNTSLLRGISRLAPSHVEIEVFDSLQHIPIFNPDNEGVNTPAAVSAFCGKISDCDGVIISSPEYIRCIPGGLKNAIDWLVSRDEIIGKPIALVHASHRGDDALDSLRRVLSTVSDNFSNDIFLQIPLIGKNADEVGEIVKTQRNRLRVNGFITTFCDHIESTSLRNRQGKR